MSKSNKFIQAIKGFLKRNAYALVVSFTVLAVFSVIAAVSVADLYKPSSTTSTDSSSTEQTVDEPAAPTNTTSVIVFESPIKNGTVSKEYAADHLLKDSTTGIWKAHLGVDYLAPEGTSVLAAYKGKVESVEKDMMNGVVVTISHGDGLKTVYKSLASASVSAGDSVATGEEIGVIGTSTSEKAEGTHLHFEVYKDGKMVDPMGYIADSSSK